MNHAWKYIAGVALLFTLVIGGCKPEGDHRAEEPLARVYDDFLYPSDVETVVSKKMSKADSAVVVRSYIDNWVRERLMLRVAEQNIPQDIDIDEMVRNYRNNLIQLYYEKNLVEQRLDSTVTKEEVRDYYEANREENILKYKVARCFFVKVPSSAPQKDELRTWWKRETPEDVLKLKSYCEQYAQLYNLEDSTWVRASDVAAQFPAGTLTEGTILKGKQLSTEKEGYIYLLEVMETVDKGQTAPLGYVREKAKSYILLKRKMELIERMSKEMYQREINKQNVEIYE